MSTEVIEKCPHCMKENDFIWDTEADGLQAYCLHCGAKMMLCSECSKNEVCDWSDHDKATNECSESK